MDRIVTRVFVIALTSQDRQANGRPTVKTRYLMDAPTPEWSDELADDVAMFTSPEYAKIALSGLKEIDRGKFAKARVVRKLYDLPRGY